MANPRQRVLFLDDEEGMCRMVEAVLSDEGFAVTTDTDARSALDAYVPGAYDVVVTDVKMPGFDGLEVLDFIRAREPAPPVIMVTAYATVDTSIQALRRGAHDFLLKPFEPEELLHRVKNALARGELLRENREQVAPGSGREGFSALVGGSPSLSAVLETAAKLAERDFPILITGESGTGKELVAQAIHRVSPRRDRPFVAINCGALPQTLLESELFGARKGAFTGADAERTGLLAAADGGTLFLDEVGNLPPAVQKLLLRFLQEKEFYKVGDTAPTRVDVRVLAATNADVEEEVREGTFREDLYYRLAVGRVKVPALRDRPEDIPQLAAHFLKEAAGRFPTHVRGLAPDAIDALRRYPWPGNVRQLRNVVEAALAVEPTDHLTALSVRQFLFAGEAAEACVPADADYASAMGRFEAAYFGELLTQCGGNVEQAAKKADVNLATFYRKIKKYGLKG